jgi:hypothetical protein
MSKTKESNLYNLIKTTIKNAHFTRLESNTINGIIRVSSRDALNSIRLMRVPCCVRN